MRILLFLGVGFLVGIIQANPVKNEDAESTLEILNEITKKREKRYAEIDFSEDAYRSPFIGDIVLSKGQAERIYDKLHGNTEKRIQKRHSIDIEEFPDVAWDLPIKYYFQSTGSDGEEMFSSAEKRNIREGIRQWEDMTCIRFEEINEKTADDFEKVLEIRGDSLGCWSYVGNVFDEPKQVLNLEKKYCTWLPGFATHEIGHVLGLYHLEDTQESKRYFHILYSNMEKKAWKWIAGVPERDVNRYGVDWDYASIMQFDRYPYSKNLQPTIIPEDSNFVYVKGMIQERPSFLDATTVNRAYECYEPRRKKSRKETETVCYNKGYPNPGISSEGDSCLCPDGLGGDCTEPSPEGPNSCSPSSGTISVTKEEQCITSPGYDEGSNYKVGDTCSWILKAPGKKGIEMWFDTTDGFGIYHFNLTGGMCFHYVEIKLDGNLTMPGRRVCGSDIHEYNQNEKVLTYDNKALVYFNALAKLPKIGYLYNDVTGFRKGFKLCFKTTDELGTPCKDIDYDTDLLTQ